MSIQLHDLMAHFHMNGDKPAGAMVTRVKTPFVMVVRPHHRARAHRPAYSVIAEVEGRTVLSTRFACGKASIQVRPLVEVPERTETCEGCDTATSSRPIVFSVYAYYDARARVLYVGQTQSLDNRHKGHRRSPWFRDAVHRGTLSEHPTREAALAAEARAIADLHPLHNVRGVAA
jgi:hypothetical protein